MQPVLALSSCLCSTFYAYATVVFSWLQLYVIAKAPPRPCLATTQTEEIPLFEGGSTYRSRAEKSLMQPELKDSYNKKTIHTTHKHNESRFEGPVASPADSGAILWGQLSRAACQMFLVTSEHQT